MILYSVMTTCGIIVGDHELLCTDGMLAVHNMNVCKFVFPLMVCFLIFRAVPFCM